MISQEALADAVGIGVATLRRLENKKIQKTPVQILARCALVLDVPLMALIDTADCEWTLPGEPPTHRETRDMFVTDRASLPEP
jgi:transcriptional regulator with XRE-family HTH domain